MRNKETISFTFPEIQDFWDRLVRRALLGSALGLTYCLATIGTRQGMREDAYVVIVLLIGALSLALSLNFWGRENKRIPGINQRFAIEFMLRTGSPTPPGDLDLLRAKQSVTVRDENGEARSWIVRRRGAVFTLAPA